MTFATLIQTVGVGTVILVLAVCLPIIFKMLIKYRELKKEHEKEVEQIKQQGAAAQAQKDALETRLQNGSETMQQLTENDKKLEEILVHQQKEIDLLIASDELDIKAYITDKYYYYIHKGYVDAEVMDILEHRFAIYKKEGGNGFAERMMSELRNLPLIAPDK